MDLPAASKPGTGLPGLRDKAAWFIYPFFGIHMLLFGLSGFLMAYVSDGPDIRFLFMHGGIAIVVYLVFYGLMLWRMR